MNASKILTPEQAEGKIRPVVFRPLTYVAGPYSIGGLPPEEVAKVKEARCFSLTMAATMLASIKKWNPFSPITHSHPMHSQCGLDGDWNFWKRIDEEYIQCSARMVIVTIPGWEQSVGVTAETKIAQSLGIPIFHMTTPQCLDGRWHSWLSDNDSAEHLFYEPNKATT